MDRVIFVQMCLPEGADDHTEALITEAAAEFALAALLAEVAEAEAQTCTYHVHTTLEGGVCPMCVLDEKYARRAPAPRWWERPLPAKDYTRSFLTEWQMED